MRMRKKHNLDTRMSAVAHLHVNEPRLNKGKWREVSGGRPIQLEIGCGKGRFAVVTAELNPDVFIIAVELESNALVVAMETAARAGVTNLLFMNINAADLELYFAPRELSRIYLNFSDPWPHSKHRRLTHERFLSSYRRLLDDGGAVWQKTDNDGLFEWSVEQFEQLGWHLDEVTNDLHGDDADGGVITEYEEKFIEQGVKINRLVAYPPDLPREIQTELREVKTSEEIAALCTFAARLWREHYTPLIGRQQVAYMLEKFQSEHAVAEQIANGYIYKLLVADGVTAGYMAVKREEKRLFLSKFYVDKRFRGQGFARLMLDECERLAEGLDAIYLTCYKHNTGSLEAYKRLGFVVIDANVTDIGGGFVMDDFVLEKELV